MRDIRDDLKERLSLLHAERDDLQAQLKAKLAQIDAYEQQITGLLALEEARAIPSASAPAMPWEIAKTSLSGPLEPAPPALPESDTVDADDNADFESDILKCLADGAPHEHADIRIAMESDGWSADKKGQLGRQIQGVLLTLKNRGAIHYLGNSVWQKATVAAEKAA